MSINKTINNPGLCVNCYSPTHEILQQYPKGHDYAGTPLRLGPPLETTMAVTLLCVNGHQMRVVMCDGCARSNLSVPAIWSKILRSFALETTDRHRHLIGAKPLTAQQRVQQRKWLVGLIDQRPLGILTLAKAGGTHATLG